MMLICVGKNEKNEGAGIRGGFMRESVGGSG